MAAPKGNQFWKAKTSFGRGYVYEDVDDFTAACFEYFEWCIDNPLKKEKAFCSQGVVVTHDEEITRPFTLNGLTIFLGITNDTWYSYCKRDGFIDITGQIAKIIRDQKIAGASIGIYNANIIARELGLKDGETTVVVNNNLNPEKALKDRQIPIPDMGAVGDLPEDTPAEEEVDNE